MSREAAKITNIVLVNVIVGVQANQAAIAISNCEITASAGNGISVAAGSKLSNFVSNNIHTNTAYPLRINIGDAAFLQDMNTYSSNGKEYIQLNGRGNTLITNSINLKRLAEPYLISGTVDAGNSIVISPACNIFMDNNATIIVDGILGNGSLSAIGSLAQPITFSPIFGGNGVWGNICFLASKSAGNVLKYCTISGGGLSGPVSGADGMINLMNNGPYGSNATISNCTIGNSSSNGIFIQNINCTYNVDISRSNMFSGNLAGNVEIQ